MAALFGKCMTIGFLLLFPVRNLIAEEGMDLRGATITVRVWDRVSVDARILARAKQMTERLIQSMRLEIRWVDCPPDPTPQNQRCISPARPNDVSVRIYRRPTKDRQQLSQKAAGVAVPSPLNSGSGFIQVFFDRLEEISRNSNGPAPLEVLLGITIAHEIGHLLLPGNQHSPSGVMQGYLGARHLQSAAKGWMRFTAEDRRDIGKNVRKWSNLSESEQNPPELASSIGPRWQRIELGFAIPPVWSPEVASRLHSPEPCSEE